MKSMCYIARCNSSLTFEALAEMLGLFRFINSYFSVFFFFLSLFFSKRLFISIYLNLFVAVSFKHK